ncbi:MAG TPA: hypothetical protein VM223_20345 [Planctomycetota bacterium]|nr:hypothetical protein [Planctomycetota bacterium]
MCIGIIAAIPISWRVRLYLEKQPRDRNPICAKGQAETNMYVWAIMVALTIFLWPLALVALVIVYLLAVIGKLTGVKFPEENS